MDNAIVRNSALKRNVAVALAFLHDFFDTVPPLFFLAQPEVLEDTA